MWMAYKTYPEVTDFKSGLNYLIEVFIDLQFDANHEAVYGMDQWMNMDECCGLAAKYRKAKQLCIKCEKGKISRLQLCLLLKGMDFDEHLQDLKQYLTPTELAALEVGGNGDVVSESVSMDEDEEDDS